MSGDTIQISKRVFFYSVGFGIFSIAYFSHQLYLLRISRDNTKKEKDNDTNNDKVVPRKQKDDEQTEYKNDEEKERKRREHFSSTSTSKLANKLSEPECRSLIEKVLKTMCSAGHESDEEDLYATHARTRGRLGKSGKFVLSAAQLGDIEHVSDTDLNSPTKKHKLKKFITTSVFKKYMHRFRNAQYDRTLCHPALPQPSHLSGDEDNDKDTELYPSRPSHRFIIGADTQFGVLMDGFSMPNPSWENEIELSRRCVTKINKMDPKPLFVCVCGDLVDTEGSFSSAIASWKEVMTSWQRGAVHRQQNQDFKQVWSDLDRNIGLVCLCGNHDVGNRPTPESINFFKTSFGDEYLAFWTNGSYNICVNNCLFFDNSGAPELYDEQLQWLEERLIYANEKNANSIFILSHFPWFLFREDETKDDVHSASLPPSGWGAEGTAFADFYFHIPIERRRIVLALFKKYNVTACFSGHFHQNLCAKTSWGMDMIVTGPLSMILKSTSKENSIQDEKKGEEEPDVCGIRIVDVDASGKGKFTHKFDPL